MPALKHLVSKMFGNLTVLSREPNNQKGRAEWLCLCRCGNTCVQSSRNLLAGWARSCGCLRLIDDMMDKKYGRIRVLGLAESLISRRTWCRCICDCGTYLEVEASSLRFGHTTSCGCGRRERAALMGAAKFINREGTTFGNLKIVRLARKEGTSAISWECLCSCGRAFVVLACNLRNGTGPSCGCKRLPDLSGSVYGLLTVLMPNGSRGRQNLWLCQCICGTQKSVRTSYLKRGLTISCGCSAGQGNSTQRPIAVRNAAVRYTHARRARKALTGGTFTAQDVTNRFKWQRGRCAMPWCRVKLTDHNATIDHIVSFSPRRRGGVHLPNLNDRRNTQLTCDPCNKEKSDKDPLTHARDKGFLL